MVRCSTRAILGIACLSLPLLARATNSPDPKESSISDLICPNDNPSDCYPRIFEPTKDFQVIKEGQDIPPGLHIRLNISTGKKEARLNIPMEGDEAESVLAGLPTEQAMVVVEQTEPEPVIEVEPERMAMRDQVPIKQPAYDTAGKIPPPIPNGASGDDMGTFQKALLTVRMEARALDKALDDLADLSHDIYYGVEIAKDKPTLEKIICLAFGPGSERMPSNENERDHKAASILSSAVQNNPTALKEVASFWKLVMYPSCASHLKDKTVTDVNLVTLLRSRLGREKSPSALKSKVGALSGLLREPTIREEFLKKNGMEVLLAMFLKKGDDFNIVRKKVAALVMDNFLDEGMGAAVGEWPKKPLDDLKTCQTKGTMLVDGCWEHHVEAFLKTSPSDAWAKDFLSALKKQRGQLTDSTQGREL